MTVYVMKTRLDFLVNITRGQSGRRSVLYFISHFFHVNMSQREKNHVPTTCIPEDSRQNRQHRFLLNLVFYQTRCRKSTAATPGGGSCCEPETTRGLHYFTCVKAEPLPQWPGFSSCSSQTDPVSCRNEKRKSLKKKSDRTINTAGVYLTSAKPCRRGHIIGL